LGRWGAKIKKGGQKKKKKNKKSGRGGTFSGQRKHKRTRDTEFAPLERGTNTCGKDCKGYPGFV